jgi:hypothetical protein
MLYIPAVNGPDLRLLPLGSDSLRGGDRPLHPAASGWVLAWVILVLGPIGPLIYIVVEVIPDLGLLRDTFQAFPRRKRIRHLEAMITQILRRETWKNSRTCISTSGTTNTLGSFTIARSHRVASPTTRSIARDHGSSPRGLQGGPARYRIHHLSRSKYDSYRAMGLLAETYAQLGEPDKAEACFEEATRISTLSETYLNYAQFLALKGARTKLETGRSACCRKSQPCQAI